MNVARSLYFQSRVPLEFWTEYVLTATFIINKTPSPLLQNKSPYQLPYITDVDYSIFKVFGCLAFTSILNTHRTKFQPRSRSVLLGYPPGIKGYKLYDVQNKQIFISKDVIFHEEIFPFHTVTNSDKLIDPFPDIVMPKPSLLSAKEFSRININMMDP